MKSHIEKLYLNAEFNSLSDGLSWYYKARMRCTGIAEKHGVSMNLVASVVAALSPRNRWTRNLVDAENIIDHVFNGADLKLCATYNTMRDKALKLCNVNLSHTDRLKILNGRKIQSFYLNIIGDDSRVTVDSWISLAYSGKYKAVKKRKALTLGRYKTIEQDFLSLAKKYNRKSYQIQAICWLEFQKQVGKLENLFEQKKEAGQ